MSETEITGGTDSGSADTGSSSNTPDIPSGMRDKAWDAIQRDPGDGKSEDVRDYVAEKTDRDAEERGDPEVNKPFRKQQRLERWQRALSRAQSEGQPTENASTENRTSDVAPPSEGLSREDEIRSARAEAQFELRAQQFMEKAPDFEKAVSETFAVFPAGDALLMAVRDSPLGPELAYLFAQNPEAIDEINSLSPEVAARYLGVIEGRLAYERHAAQQQSEAVIRFVRADKPVDYLKIIASVLPKELLMPDSPLNDVSDDDLAEAIAIYRAMKQKQAA